MKNLIIGKNSKIVREISSELKNYDFISHKDISATDFNNYQKVIIFSWSNRSLVENINFSNFLNFFGKVSSSYSTKTNPLAKLIDDSILSANLLPKEEFKTILSTRI